MLNHPPGRAGGINPFKAMIKEKIDSILDSVRRDSYTDDMTNKKVIRVENVEVTVREELEDLRDEILEFEKETAWKIWEKLYREQHATETVKPADVVIPLEERLKFDHFWLKENAGREEI